MLRFTFISLLVTGLLIPGSSDLPAADSGAKEKPGLRRIQLVTDVSAISPGETLTVALVIDPLPGYHTYWRGPGIVGVATAFDWTLPQGFIAGEVSWPPPQKVLMAGITAYGYRDKTMLLTDIETPEKIEGNEVTLRVRISWMACATSCNPGVDDFSLTLPVHRTSRPAPKEAALSKAFDEVRRSVPPTEPETWSITPRSPAPDRIELDLTIPGFPAALAPSISFYCYDMQVDSDEPQQVTVINDAGKETLRLTLVRPDFAPRSPATISGVLHCPGGWPGLNSPYVEISAPWPAGTFGNE